MKLGLKALPKPATFDELLDSITNTPIPLTLFDKVEDVTLDSVEMELVDKAIAEMHNITDAGFEGEPDGLI